MISRRKGGSSNIRGANGEGQPVKRPRLSAAVSYDIMNEDYIYLYYISAID